MEYVNLTPHAIVLNDGRVFEPSGAIARIAVAFSVVEGDFCSQEFGEITGLPEVADGIFLIVSGMVHAANQKNIADNALCGGIETRPDLVAPATGHPLTVRNEKGHIVSVPCFIKGF